MSSTYLFICLLLLGLQQCASAPVAADTKCKKLLWFTSVAGPSAMVRVHLRVALMSQKEHAPSLIPHLLYAGDRDDHVARWYADNGGTVHHHQLSFYDKIERLVKVGERTATWLTIAHGTLMRLDLPLVMRNISIDDPTIETGYVLYTDADVMFMADVTTCSFAQPATVSIGPEHKRGVVANAGVMYINMTAFSADHAGLVAWGVTRNFPQGLDQAMLLSYYHGRLGLLPDEFNWKGYWGRGANVSIIHFHGPKPDKCLTCLVLNSLGHGTGNCRCPEVYTKLWESAPDSGAFYKDTVLLYYKFLAQSHGSVLYHH